MYLIPYVHTCIFARICGKGGVQAECIYKESPNSVALPTLGKLECLAGLMQSLSLFCHLWTVDVLEICHPQCSSHLAFSDPSKHASEAEYSLLAWL